MNPVVGWVLVAVALAAGHVGYGWPGVVLALSVIVFWLLLQFSRSLRIMGRAGRAPVGRVDSAVMLASRLRPGMTMLQLLPLTNSLGQPVGVPADETYRWRDAGDCGVLAIFSRGRLRRWTLERPPEHEAVDPP